MNGLQALHDIETLKRRLLLVEATLAEVEWAGSAFYNGHEDAMCPSCGGLMKDGHEKECTLAAVLASPVWVE